MTDQNLSIRLRKIDEKIKELDDFIRIKNKEKRELIKEREHIEACLKSKKIHENIDFENESFPWTLVVKDLLYTSFNLKTFRPLQLKTINATLSKRDCILIKPTGGGKSLCYQLPSLISGFSLVVSPLISLMYDQIMIAERYGIKCASLDSSCPTKTQNEIYKSMENDPVDNVNFNLIFITPEKIAKSKKFKKALEKAYSDKRIVRIVIDEIHCCSQWGHDFRLDYSYLHIFKSLFPELPILGLTATASGIVINDIKEILSLDYNLLIFKDHYNRTNLFYDVKYLTSEDSESKEISDIISKSFRNQTGIVYCFSQKECETLNNNLRASGINSSYYHANLIHEERKTIHEQWLKGNCKVIVATIAFGMGIDKENVRFVIHASMSKSLENYYQESGRAGRDGNRADCILLWKLSDYFRLGSNLFQEKCGILNLNKMCQYALDLDKCKRINMAKIFEDRYSSNDCEKMCCRCLDSESLLKIDIRDIYNTAFSIISKIEASKNPKITGTKMVNELFNQMKVFKTQLKSNHPEINIYIIFDKALCYLILEGYLKLDFHFGSFKNFAYIMIGDNKLNANESIWLDMINPRSFLSTEDILNVNSIEAESTKKLINLKRKKIDSA